MNDFFGAIWTALAAFLAAAAASWVLPSVRWARWLKRDLDIFNGLPIGLEKDSWGVGIEARARRLRRYQREVRVSERIVTMVSVVIVAFLIATLFVVLWHIVVAWAVQGSLSEGDAADDGGVAWTSVFVLVVLIVIFLPFATDGLRGRPIGSFAMDPINALRRKTNPGVPLPKEPMDPDETEAWLRTYLQGLGYTVEKTE